MQQFKTMFMLTLCLLFSTASLSFAQDEFDEESLSSILEVKDEDRYLTYGVYAEVEISGKKISELEFNSEIIPYGLELEKVSQNTFLLFGRAEFIGKLCFLLNATTKNSEQTVERLCLYSDDNEDLAYPKIDVSADLESIKVNKSFNKSIKVSSDETAETVVIAGLVPGIKQSSLKNGGVKISGKIKTAGVYEFILKATELQTEINVYKQVTLEVTEKDISYQCAPGYYYDDYLGHCVQTRGTCAEGTFYDSESGECRSYRTNICRAGQYFDHWLNRCVISSANRCPINYEWDGYYNRCTRLPYTCSIGERYNHRLNSCVSIYRHRSCSIGYHWNSYRSICVRSSLRCSRYEYWSGSRCRVTSRSCNAGRYFDPYNRRCVSRATTRTCYVGQHWDHRVRACVRRPVVVNRTCSIGSRWSSNRARCVVYDNGRINRHPRRPHRPVVTRPTRPTRPTTRPAPTRPTPPTTRPAPNGPTRCRPGTATPCGPTTRPTTPNRPTRPTTRPAPTRPTPPTTRPAPTRPTRPTTRPAPTRPTPPTTRPAPTRPTPPTTRPAPTRPTRPTTRPAPTRPTRPTTRPAPTRPTRPTTRPAPTRPTRPNGPRRCRPGTATPC